MRVNSCAISLGSVTTGKQSTHSSWSIEVLSPTTICIKDHHRKYLTISKGGDLKTTRDACAPWEWKDMGGGEIAFKGNNGKWMSCNRSGGVTADKAQVRSYEKWKLSEVVNKFYIRCCSDATYLGVSEQNGQVLSASPQHHTPTHRFCQ